MIIVDKIHDRLHVENKNWLAVICGKTGSGKTYSALKLANAIDPTFNIDRVCFTPQEFLNVVTNGKLKRGQAIVFDEAGVAINSRDWYSISNKMINFVVQTFRRDNLAVIFTVPSFDFIDSATRKMFHAYIETSKINFATEQVYTKFFTLDFNSLDGKLYRKYFRVGQKRLNPFKIGMPEFKLVIEYEKKKKKFTKTLQIDAERALIKKGLKDNELPNAHCNKCGYEWVYKGANRPTCSKCKSNNTTTISSLCLTEYHVRKKLTENSIENDNKSNNIEI